MKHYIYRITFPGMPWFYYGVHTENSRSYSGSPKTHKWLWSFYEYEVQILQWFASREEAERIETRIINHFLNDENCLNECSGGKFSLESLRRGAKVRNALPITQETREKLKRSTQSRWNNATREEYENSLRGLWKGTPESLRDSTGKKIQRTKGKSIVIHNEVSGETKQFPSLQSARKYYGIGMSTIAKLASGKISEYKGLRVIRAGIA